ncbi:phosphoinositide 3-kinase adapter protein 1 isoform X2 [Hypanus sabinus]|uniref:phosphoinositide 3-kinase adapter protein 1 isoform X2 n=1 Tax=Hypanus sabinus TaxID=79690 RepID=UPI0028C3AAA3|nr:phosphoinositide 3-kinase adapter protein 1 isoform X2 [Hypanus sabinus]
MSASGQMIKPDVVILNTEDASEWTDYLANLLTSSHHLEVLPLSISEDTSFTSQDHNHFNKCKCLLVVLSPQFLDWIVLYGQERGLHRILRPVYKVIVLLCGAVVTPELQALFGDWNQWRQLSCEDEPDSFTEAVEETISESNSRDSGLDTTESEGDYKCEVQRNLAKSTEASHLSSTAEHLENMVKVLPERIQCGVPQPVFVILKVKLDSKVKNEMDFTMDKKSVRVPALFVNEYTLTANAPDMSPGLVSLTVYSGDLKICSASLIYYTDMEEIENLLNNAINPVEFMCQAFHIIPYNRETLDKLLTESLRRNMPANGLHIFGINQLEEDDMSTTQRDKELPTLLHFSAMYGLKNLTALLLQCPGALQAYSVANKDGDYPNNMAEKNGYRDLRQFMDEYVETADMLKTHLKEELCGNMEGEENEDLYESMATVTKDILMKCSLNPGCDEDIYESMIEMLPSSNAMDSTYESMSNISELAQSSQCVPDLYGPTKDSILRSFLQGSIKCNAPLSEEDEDAYNTRIEDIQPKEIANRPPAPNPRVPIVPSVDDMQPYISKALPPRSKQPLSRAPSSDYDPFAGMKTPGQRQLITLQEQVKLGMINVDEALLQFKEWQLNQKRRSDSFRFQQENLKKLRDSITRRQNIKGRHGKSREMEITLPARSQDILDSAECGVYEANPRFISPCPIREGIQRGQWNTGSTSSTASSLSSRSSTRSVLSLSSGAEGDNEDNEPMTCGPTRSRLSRQRPPSLPPPRIPPRGPSRSPNQPSVKSTPAPPVPPRGR